MSLLLIDSASLWYRAYYGMPDTMLAPDGTPVNAIRGFLDMTARLVTQYKPTRIVACLEGDWRPTWRTDIFPGYKANRVDEAGEEDEPDTLAPQIPLLLDLLDLFGLPMVGVDNYEADDLIATYSKSEKGPIHIVTGDRDLFQLVDDARKVKVIYLAKGFSQQEVVDLAWIKQKYGIPGERYALFALIRGDASDGLPGVKGIGEKGAAIIANSFATIEESLAAALNDDERLTPLLRKRLIEGSDYIKIAPTLVHCALDVPVPTMEIALPKAPLDLSEIYAFKDQYGLGASVDRLIAALGW
jgi:5'-3' exonuclease